MKKIISLILAVLTLCSLVVFSASAENEGPYYYKVLNNYATITGVTEKELSGVVTIPETLGGYPVRTIGSKAFSGDRDITKVIIPSSVQFIFPYAFNDCTKIYSITIHEGSNRLVVDANAFYGCTNLKIVHIYAKKNYVNSFTWSDENVIKKDDIHHVFHKDRIEPVCKTFQKADGNEEGWYCSKCDRYLEGGAVIPANHVDEKDNNGYCDKCGILTCTHKCHKDLDGIAEFFWKIELFFWKLFKIYPECICGAAHY